MDWDHILAILGSIVGVITGLLACFTNFFKNIAESIKSMQNNNKVDKSELEKIMKEYNKTLKEAKNIIKNRKKSDNIKK